MEEILNKIKPKCGCMTIDAKGSIGGITILWKLTKILVDYWIGMKRVHIGKFRLIGNREWFLVSTVYGLHTPMERGSFLDQLQ